MIILLQFTLLAVVSSFGKQVNCYIYPTDYDRDVSLLEYIFKIVISIPYQISMNANSNRIFSLLFILSTQYIVVLVDQIIENQNWFIRYFMFEGFTVIIMPIYMHFSLHLGCLNYKRYLKIYYFCYALSIYIFYFTTIEFRQVLEFIIFINVSIYSYFHSLYLDFQEKTVDYIYYTQAEFKSDSIVLNTKYPLVTSFVSFSSHEQQQHQQNINIRHRRNQQTQFKSHLKDVIFLGKYKGNLSALQIYDKNIFIIKSILLHRKTLSNYTAEHIFASMRNQIQTFQYDQKMKAFIIYRRLAELKGEVQVYSLSNLSKPIKIISVSQNPQDEVDIDIENKLFYYIDSQNNLIETSYITTSKKSYKINEGFLRHKIKVFNSSDYKVLVCYRINSTKLYMASLSGEEFSDDQSEIYLQKKNIYVVIKQLFMNQNQIVVVTDTLTYLFNPLTLNLQKVLKDFQNFLKIKKVERNLLIMQSVEREDQFIIDSLTNPSIEYKSSEVINLAFLGDSNQRSTSVLLFLPNDRFEIVSNVWVKEQKEILTEVDQLKT